MNFSLKPIWWLLVCGIGLMIGVVTFAHVMTRPIEPNEHMYLAASVLAVDHQLYSDFAFVQMPYLPRLYALMFRVFGDEYLLLQTRLFTWMVFVASIFVIAAIAWHYTRNRVTVISSTVVFACSDSIILITGESSNYALPMMMTLLAYWLLVASNRRGTSVLVGLLLGMSVCLKLYYITLVPIFIGYPWITRSFQRTGLHTGVGVAFGVAFAVSPATWDLLSDPDRFMFNNLGYHRWKTGVYFDQQYGDRMTLVQRIRHGKTCLQHASQMWLPYTAALALIVLLLPKNRLSAWQKVGFPVVVTVVCLGTAMLPIPAWSQYFAMPVPFAWVVAIVLSAMQPRLGRLVLASAAIVGVFVTGPEYARIVAKLTKPDGWVPMVLHKRATELVDSIDGNRPLIAGTASLVTLEGNGEIYPEWALSGFMFEISDDLTDEQLKRYRVTAPKQLDEFLSNRPPAAIITRDTIVDRPLIEYAESNGFAASQYPDLGVTLWSPKPNTQ